MRNMRSILTGIVLAAAFTGVHSASGQTPTQQGGAAPAAPSQTVPVMDGGAGPCSLDLSVTNDGKPVAAADVKVHISYGFAGVRRLDLEAYTNHEGKVKFAGLPARVRQPPLEFRASKDRLVGIAVYDPQTECHARHEITLVRQRSGQN
jgi:hypothetical protein